ncbi:MAG TPA: urease subunit gamma [Nitrososphaeraceae archaeon]|nr:urease subunit gamma [Nitrososphaeraceae archaeon]
MIDVTVIVQGDPDTVPFTRIFRFYNKADYIILSKLIKSINDKLSKDMRINLNETLYIYLNYIIKELRLHRKTNEMITNASTLLTPDQVMIGVPESLRKISFNVVMPNSQRLKITIKEPISTTGYILAP